MTLDGLLLVTEPQALAGILGKKLECEIVVKYIFVARGTLTPLQMSFASLLQILGYLEDKRFRYYHFQGPVLRLNCLDQTGYSETRLS